MIALPICTAPPEIDSLSLVSSTELNVAPWMPSRPVRPPMATIRSPGSTDFARHPAGDHADGPAKDQGIGQVGRMADQRAVDGRDAHPIAVVADPGDDPLEDSFRVQHAARQRVARGPGRAGDAEDVRIADRLGPEAGAERVADHAAEPGVGPAVRVDRRGVVVGLDLEADVEIVVEPDDPGVVGEDADQPVAPISLGRAEDRLLEQVVDDPPFELDPTLGGSCASNARSRSAPGFPTRSRSGRGRARRSGALDGLQLGEAEVQLPFPADFEQFGVGSFPWIGTSTLRK